MSYPIDLDEYPAGRLKDELERRAEATAKGVCDYCGRDGNTTPCRFPERHNKALEVLNRRAA